MRCLFAFYLCTVGTFPGFSLRAAFFISRFSFCLFHALLRPICKSQATMNRKKACQKTVKIASAQARDLDVQMLLMHKMAIEMYVILHLDILFENS